MNITLNHNTTIKNLSRSRDKKSFSTKQLIFGASLNQLAQSQMLDRNLSSWTETSSAVISVQAWLVLNQKSNLILLEFRRTSAMQSSAKTGALWVVFSLIVARLRNPHCVSELFSHRGNKLIASLGIIKVEWKQGENPSNSQELGL